MTHRLLAEFGASVPLTFHGYPAFGGPVGVYFDPEAGGSPRANRGSGWLAMTEADRFDFGDSDEWRVEIDRYPTADGDSF